MKKSIFLFAMFAGLSTALFAQDNYISKSLTDLGTELNWTKRVVNSSMVIEGSPYLNEEFQEGEVFYEGKFKISKVPLRYNLNSDEMEFIDRGTVMAIAFPDKIDKIILGDETFIFIDENDNKAVKGYVLKWNDGLPSILTKMKVDFFDKEPPQPIVEAKPARYERAYDSQFLIKDSGEIELVKSVKKLIQSLGDHEKELSDYAKREKISNSKPEELAKLIDYYDSLQ